MLGVGGNTVHVGIGTDGAIVNVAEQNGLRTDATCTALAILVMVLCS